MWKRGIEVLVAVSVVALVASKARKPGAPPRLTVDGVWIGETKADLSSHGWRLEPREPDVWIRGRSWCRVPIDAVTWIGGLELRVGDEPMSVSTFREDAVKLGWSFGRSSRPRWEHWTLPTGESVNRDLDKGEIVLICSRHEHKRLEPGFIPG